MDPIDWMLLLIALVSGIAVPIEGRRLMHTTARRSRRAIGRVVGIVARQGRPVHEAVPLPVRDTLHARVAFEVGGKTFEVVDSLDTSFTRSRIGSSLPVAYDPRHPEDAAVARQSVASDCCLVWGGPLFGLLLLGLVVMRHLPG